MMIGIHPNSSSRPVPTVLAAAAVVLMTLTGCQAKENDTMRSHDENRGRKYPVSKTDEQWRKELTDEEFRVLRKAGTELACSGEYWDHKGEGTYVCAGCGQELFATDTKYKSGTGWPSFTAPVAESAVVEEEDNSLGMRRTEVLCSNCGGHLGHVFPDGPEPSGLRYCINSVSLHFKEAR